MHTSETLVIPRSYRKLSRQLAGSVLLSGLGIFLLAAPTALKLPLLGNPGFIYTSGLTATLFFGFTSLLYLWKLVDPKPGLILSADGFTDHSSSIRSGYIPWGDITDISVIEIHGQRLLRVHVQDPVQYINRQNNRFSKYAMKLNYRLYGTPLCLTNTGLQCDFDKLKHLIDTYNQPVHRLTTHHKSLSNG